LRVAFLPIGGLKEKLLAAPPGEASKPVLIPDENVQKSQRNLKI